MSSLTSRLRPAATSIVAAAGAVLFVLVMRWPASATITSTSVSSTNATQNTVCPTSVMLNGVVNGTPNKPFQYWFGYLINNALTITPVITATMPASGSMNVQNTMTIPATTMPGSVGQLGASIVGQMGTHPVLSNDVPLAITCNTQQPPPPPPTNLQNTIDPTVCAQHIFPLICAGTAVAGLTLVWNWSPNSSFPSLTGYNVYNVSGGSYTLVSHGTAGASQTGTLLNPMSGGFGGKCYVVRAYIGSTESGNSNQFCVPATPPAPTGLQNTTDSTVCAQHIFPLICIGMSASALTLVWNWTPSSAFPTLTGYNVYNVSGPVYTLVSHGTAGAGGTGTLLNPISGGFGGKCYVVRAYLGSSESPDSNQFCISGPGTIVPLVLTPSNAATLGVNRQVRGLNGGLFTNGIGCGDGHSNICMGWSHWESGSAPFELYDDQFYRAYVDYPQSQIAATKNITNATLSLTMAPGNSPACFGSLTVALGQWIGQSEPTVNGDPSYALRPQFVGNNVTFDVTNVIKDWASGAKANFGFVFAGTLEDNELRDNSQCMLEMQPNPTLTITHY